VTTVVAVAHGRDVWMAADTMTNIYDRPVYTARKIRRVSTPSGDLLLGFSGDGALADMIQYRVGYPALTDKGFDVWATDIAIAISKQGVTEGIVADGRLDGNLILGVGGGLWTLVHMQAVAHDDGMAAIGTGEGPAIGALETLLRLGEKPQFAVQQACAVGISRDRYSGGDVQVEHLEGNR